MFFFVMFLSQFVINFLYSLCSILLLNFFFFKNEDNPRPLNLLNAHSHL